MRFTYCPDCGRRLKDKEIGDEGFVPYCEKCEKPWFELFSACVIILIINEYGEAALLRQNYISDFYYNLVSGYIKPGECAEETAKREIQEEIGIEIKQLNFVNTYWFAKKDMLMIGFIATAKKEEFTLSKEVDAAFWIPAKKALKMVHPKGSASYALIEYYLSRESENFS